MKLDILERLVDKINEVRRKYDNPDREKNTAADRWVSYAIRGSGGDDSAVVDFTKSSGTHTLIYFFYLRGRRTWYYFVPTQGHRDGMKKFLDLFDEVFDKNIADNIERIKQFDQDHIYLIGEGSE